MQAKSLTPLCGNNGVPLLLKNKSGRYVPVDLDNSEEVDKMYKCKTSIN